MSPQIPPQAFFAVDPPRRTRPVYDIPAVIGTEPHRLGLRRVVARALRIEARRAAAERPAAAQPSTAARRA
jgi:hypothetical protein